MLAHCESCGILVVCDRLRLLAPSMPVDTLHAVGPPIRGPIRGEGPNRGGPTRCPRLGGPTRIDLGALFGGPTAGVNLGAQLASTWGPK